jgi:histidine triad (HIT) family protein
MECVFCRIVQGKARAQVLHEDEHCVAFQDIAPQAPVHVLIVPRRHIPHTLALREGGDEALMGHLVQVANRLARKLGVADRGFRLVINTNAEAGQTVFHLHVHLLAGRPMHWPPG